MTTATSPVDLQTQLAERDFEQVVLCRDPDVALESIIAIHDTTLGPSLGGVRMRQYPSRAAALADAMNLAEAMTYKSALAGLSLGGGKSVINADPRTPNRDEIIVAHAKYIATLDGRYIPNIDMGTSVRDLELIGRYVPIVSGQGRDPSYFTARGVVHSIEVALEASAGKTVDGSRVAIQGLGNVGLHVARMLTDAGAEVLAADIDPDKVHRAVDEMGVFAMDLADVLAAEVDLVAPCAGGGVIDEQTLVDFRARAIVGAANNVLSHPRLAQDLLTRGIVHVPDFVANAGGIISVEAEMRDGETDLHARVEAIGATAREVLDRSVSTATDTVTVALSMAKEIVESNRKHRPYFRSF